MSYDGAMGLFDVHAHLTSSRFDADRDEVIGRARAAGVTTVISNGLNVTDNEQVRLLAQKHALVRPAFGLYPVDAVLPEMTALGIDYPRDEETLRRFRADTGKSPDESPRAWDTWRTERVTSLVRDIRHMLRVERPLLELSVAAGPDPELA